MHLVFLNQYYPPDSAPTGLMVEAVAAELTRQGHEVTVLCAAGGYADEAEVKEEVSGDVRIVRVGATKLGRGSFLGKLLDYASYYLGVAWQLARLDPAPDRIVALTTPPYLSLLARAVSRLRGCDHAHWVMDLYPDVMVAHGMMAKGGISHRLLAALARWGFGGARSGLLLTLGPDMAGRMVRLMGESDVSSRIRWVPLWGTAGETAGADAVSVAALRAARGWRPEELVVMYSGNMGLGHRFGEILDMALRAQGQPMRFVFYGRGKRREEIAHFLAEHSNAAVELHDYAPREQLGAHLATADLHLVSLEPSWTGTMLPSKLQGIFQAGKPALFIGDAESSIAVWIRESGGGWVVAPDDAEALRAALAEASVTAERKRRGAAAADFARLHFDQTLNSRRIAAIMLY
jgi:glycosyltransferase involved in cell wall biosynthesis